MLSSLVGAPNDNITQIINGLGAYIQLTFDTHIMLLGRFEVNILSPINVTIYWGDGIIESHIGVNGMITYNHTYSLVGTHIARVYFSDPTVIDAIFISENSIVEIDNFNVLTNCNDVALDDHMKYVNTHKLPPALQVLYCNDNLLWNVDLTALPNTITNLQFEQNYFSVPILNNMLIWLDTNSAYFLNPVTFDTQLQHPIAVPTGAGAAAKASLIGKGWTVFTD
jgi:hypothetical protein